MELNDFQYNWYLHFEEENEKSIVGLPFDPYFEAHKYDSETILDYVPQTRKTSKIETSLLNIVSDCLETLMEIPHFFGSLMLMSVDDFCDSEAALQLAFYTCFPIGVYIYHLLEIHMGWVVVWPLTIAVGSLIIVPIILGLAALRYLVDIMPHAYTFMFTSLVMSASINSTSEAAVDNDNVSSSEEHHVFMPDDQPTAEQFCSLVEQSGRSWFYKYTVKDDDVYLVESHRKGKLDNPVLLNKDDWYEAVYIVKKLHSECMQNFE